MKELFNELMDNSLFTTTIFFVCFTSFFGILGVLGEKWGKEEKKMLRENNKDAIKEELEKIEQNLIQTRELLKKLEKDYGNG